MRSLLTLNVSRPPKDRAPALLEYLWQRDEDVLVLTETARGGGSDLIATVCSAAGYHVHSSLSGGSARSLGVLVVGRRVGVTRAADVPAPGVLPERLLALDVARRGRPGAPPTRLIAVYGAASDPLRYASSGQRQRKREWLAAFLAVLAELPPRPTVLAGDLNIVAPGHAGRLPYALAEERAAYEMITGQLGYADPYAAAGGSEPTWIDHSGGGCRYDYALTGPAGPGPGRVSVDPTPRLAGLTDHSALSWRADATGEND